MEGPGEFHDLGQLIKSNLSISLSGTDRSTEIGRRTVTRARKKRVLITLLMLIKEEIKIVFIIIRYQDFLVEFKVGDFCTRDDSGIVSVLLK